MKKLLIVESPAKTKTIAKFLGDDFRIMSTVGHIKDLPSKELGVSMNDHIHIDYVVLDTKEKIIADICKQASRSDEIFLAPDPDREGEIIAWHIAQEIAKVVKDSDIIHRISFNEITKQAVEEAIAQPSVIDLDKVAAQQARRVLDRWVGYEVSPILWRKVTKGLSAGRVQSVALRLICDRELAIREFVPQEYWTIDGLFTYNRSEITATLTHINKKKAEIKSRQEADSLTDKLKASSFAVTSIKDSKRLKNPSPPFMTSTLQQSAYNQLGFSVHKTMTIAQKLYEGIPLEDASTPIALITYMRTDSLRIAESALKSARTLIEKEWGKGYLPTKAALYSKSKGQDAHEAIRPIDVKFTPEKVTKFLEKDAARLYELIWQRFIASQMKPAQYAQRQVLIEGNSFTFKVTGSTLIFDGFLKVYTDEEETQKDAKENTKIKIPSSLKEGQQLELGKVIPKQHFTEPPPRYTEASLVKDLEKEGIGRPSTYATIMKTIQARSYTHLDTKKRFVPTDLGMVVTKMLTEYLPDIMNIKFTALMEEELDKIANGTLARDAVLREFYHTFEKDLELFRGEKAKRPAEPTGISCPDCKQGELVIRFGKAGPFLGCTRYPECKFTSNFERLENGTIQLTTVQAPSLLEQTCELCQKNLRSIKGKYGTFIACSGYPDCKYIYYPTANFPCPQCASKVIQRSWKGKSFWGCSNYPNCKFSIAGEIKEIPCPQCASPYLVKKGENLVCNKKDCGYRQ